MEYECPEKEIPTGVEEQNLSPETAETAHDEGSETWPYNICCQVRSHRVIALLRDLQWILVTCSV